MRQELDRAKALKRLYERQLDKTSDRLDPEARKARAAAMMDELLGGKAWRAEAAIPEVVVIETSVLRAPTPAAGGREVRAQAEHNQLLDRVARELGKEGGHPDGVPADVGQETDRSQLLRGLARVGSEVEGLLESLGDPEDSGHPADCPGCEDCPE